ncbi:PssE/Cps14G family polysaccharide biosynthesis glycosyltransferase [Butyrivibrio sp. JL13D10]|uniref:PssE/Cps14G family polysaccharide biosynthesis glycosyltransferase n=1 Tax=Butyrivibrio sp. JL13D10 TaxID=3236815 RepID=UPI0038B45EAD
MIFVSVGTQKFQMDRLMKQVEILAARMPDKKFVVQYGNSTYIPKNCECHQFMDRELFSKCIDESELLILHGGVGTIMQGLKHNKPIIVVPRLKEYHEHVDDHQMEAAWALKHFKCVLICMNVEYLEYMINHANEYHFKKFIEPKHKVEELVLECIEEETEPIKHTWPLPKRIKNFFALGPKNLSDKEIDRHKGI